MKAAIETDSSNPRRVVKEESLFFLFLRLMNYCAGVADVRSSNPHRTRPECRARPDPLRTIFTAALQFRNSGLRELADTGIARDISDGSIGLLQLRLTELDDRTQTQLVAPLGEIQTQVGLLSELFGHRHSLKCRIRGQPCGAHVASHLIAQISGILRRCVCPVLSLRCLRAEKETIKDGDTHIHANGAVPARNKVVGKTSANAIGAHRSYSGGSLRANGGWEQVALSAAKFFGCLLVGCT